MSQQQAVAAILLLAFGLRLAWVLYSPSVPTNDFMRYANYGVRIADGLGFSTIAGPTAFSPPLYPYFLGGIFVIFGQYVLVVKLLQILLGVLIVYLTYRLTAELFSPITARVVALITAVAPSLISYTTLLATENITLPLLVGSVFCWVVGLNGKGTRWFLAAGFLLGLTTLSRAAFLLLPAAWFSYLILTRQTLRPAFWLILAMGATLLPWTVRNYIVFDAFVPVSTNGGYNLLVSFNANSNGTWQERQVGNALGWHFDWETTRLENGMSETELDRRTRHIALTFIRENPLAALRLAPLKFWLTMRDDVSGIQLNLQRTTREIRPITVQLLRAAAQLHYTLVLILAVVGLWKHRTIRRQHSRQFYAPLIPILFLLAVHTVFFGDDRFHLPILPFIYVYSGVAIVYLFGVFRFESGEK